MQSMASISGSLLNCSSSGGLISFSVSLRENLQGFVPGQYCRVTITDPPWRDNRGDSRTFCVIEYDAGRRILRFATMDGISAFKRSLKYLKNGHPMEIQGPFGNFYAPGESDRSVFVAYGIGITPIISIASLMSERALGSALILQGSYADGFLPLREEMVEMTENSQLVRYIPVIMKDENRIDDLGSSGLLQETSLQFLESATIYLSGPEKIMRRIMNDLKSNLPASTKIRSEFFTGY